MSSPRTSGTAVLSLREFLERTYGSGSFGKAVGRLPAEAQAEWGGILMPTQWYSTASFVGIIDAARDLFGPPDLPERYGDFAATYELNFFHKFVLRFTSPTWFLQRGSRIWRSYHDTGEWQIEGSPRRLNGQLRDFGVVSGTYCRVLCGWLRRAGLLTGAREMKVAHPRCRAAMSPVCVFTGEW